MKPCLQGIGRLLIFLLFSFRSRYFSVWKANCCSSAITQPAKKSSQSRVTKISVNLNYGFEAEQIGAENQYIRQSWQQEVKKKLSSYTNNLGQFFLIYAHRQSSPADVQPPFLKKLKVSLAPHRKIKANMMYCLSTRGLPSQCTWKYSIWLANPIGSRDQTRSTQEQSPVTLFRMKIRVPRWSSIMDAQGWAPVEQQPLQEKFQMSLKKSTIVAISWLIFNNVINQKTNRNYYQTSIHPPSNSEQPNYTCLPES